MGRIRDGVNQKKPKETTMSDWLRVFWRYLTLPLIQITALTCIQLVGFVLGAQLAGFRNEPAKAADIEISSQQANEQTVEQEKPAENSFDRTSASQAEQARMFGVLVLVCLTNSVAMFFWIQQCTLTGVSLFAVSFAVFFFCMTIMPLSDAYLFSSVFGGIFRASAILGLCVSLSFAISTVPIFGRWRKQQSASELNLLQGITFSGFFYRILVSALAYVTLYLVFGYFVAWQNPELRQLYGGSGDQVLGFWDRITSPPTSNRVIPFQLFRGCVWAVMCACMICFSRGGRWRLAIAIGLVLAVIMNSQLLLPNPFMSSDVRMTHMIETASSNFLFGIICVWLWTARFKRPSLE